MADKLVDMKYTKAEAKEAASFQPKDGGPEYPWGLQISLEEDQIKKLGLDAMPEVGGELHLQCIAKVTGVNATQYADGKTERCLRLQITMVGVELEESAADEKGEKETPASEAAETRKASRGGVVGKY